MDDLVKAVDRAENSRKENGMKVGQAGGDAAARWLESRKLRGVKLVFIHLSSNSYFCFRGVNSTYAAASVICELLYGLNIFIQWWMVDAFLGRCSCFIPFQILQYLTFLSTLSLYTGQTLAIGQERTLTR